MRTHSEAALLPLIGRLYDRAVGGSSVWQGIAQDIAKAFDSSSAVLKTHWADGSVDLNDTTANLIVPDQDADLARHWHQNDLWVDRSVAYGKGRIVTSEQLVPSGEFERSGFFQDWLRRLEIYHMVGAVVDAGDGATCVLGIHRPKSAGAYSRGDRQRAASLIPHLQRALELHRVARQGNMALGATTQALTAQGECVMVVDTNSRLLFCSPAAEAMLAGEHLLNIIGGRIVARDARTQALLTHAIQLAVQLAQGHGSPQPSPTIALTRPGCSPLTVSVSPLGADACARIVPNVPAALVVVHDPEHIGQDDMRMTQTFQAVFDLTPREAALASEMFKGKLLNDAARTLGISEGHARQRLKLVFHKTGTSHQSALVARLARYV